MIYWLVCTTSYPLYPKLCPTFNLSAKTSSNIYMIKENIKTLNKLVVTYNKISKTLEKCDGVGVLMKKQLEFFAAF